MNCLIITIIIHYGGGANNSIDVKICSVFYGANELTIDKYESDSYAP